MIDLIEELNAVRRETAHRTIPAGEGRTVVLRRMYDTTIDDVWDAITTRERIERWFLPISGDLKLGGTYQLEGNARGTILACEPPTRLKVTWIYGEDATERDISEVEMRLSSDGDATVLELEHAAVPPEEFWATYGPGAVGVGWDLALLGLSAHLAGETLGDPRAWEATPEARDFMTHSARSWGEAMVAAGANEEEATSAVWNTTAFYVPETTEE